MLDREYEQYLQSNSGSATVEKTKGHLLWLIVVSVMIVPAILYLVK
ncbi:hypothetical protein V6C27_08630 [Peptococcaceae bacterium 1198_IL3148]